MISLGTNIQQQIKIKDTKKILLGDLISNIRLLDHTNQEIFQSWRQKIPTKQTNPVCTVSEA